MLKLSLLGLELQVLGLELQLFAHGLEVLDFEIVLLGRQISINLSSLKGPA